MFQIANRPQAVNIDVKELHAQNEALIFNWAVTL